MLKILAFLLLLTSVKHEYHVAICEITQKKNKLQFTQKIFIDDLEKAIEKHQSIRLLLGNVSQHPKAKDIIGNYLLKRWQIQVAGKKLNLSFIGYELENEQVFAYLETACPSKIKAIQVSYPLLTDIYNDQSNLVHFNILGKKKSIYLNAGSTTETVSFK